MGRMLQPAFKRRWMSTCKYSELEGEESDFEGDHNEH